MLCPKANTYETSMHTKHGIQQEFTTRKMRTRTSSPTTPNAFLSFTTNHREIVWDILSDKKWELAPLVDQFCRRRFLAGVAEEPNATEDRKAHTILPRVHEDISKTIIRDQPSAVPYFVTIVSLTGRASDLVEDLSPSTDLNKPTILATVQDSPPRVAKWMWFQPNRINNMLIVKVISGP